MSGRKKEIKHGKAKSQRIYIEPISNTSINKEKLARALARLALNATNLAVTNTKTSSDLSNNDLADTTTNASDSSDLKTPKKEGKSYDTEKA